MATILIRRGALLRSLRAVAPFQCADVTRPHLCAVQFEVHDRRLRLVATDGHTMAVAAPLAECEGVDGSALLRSEHVGELIAAMKCKRSETDQPVTMEITSSLDVPVTVRTAGLEWSRPCSVERYPPWRAVCPDRCNEKDRGAGVFGVDPRYLARAGDSATAFAYDPKNRTTGLRMSVPSGVTDPIRLDYSCPYTGDLTMIVMPMRI